MDVSSRLRSPFVLAVLVAALCAFVPAASSLVSTTSGAASAMLAGPVAAYSFDEGAGTTVADTSGSGNDGTLSNASWSSAGEFGSAASFNGTSSWMTASDSSSLDVTSGITLEAWVKPTVFSGHQTVIVKERPNGGFPWKLELTSGVPDTYLRTTSPAARPSVSAGSTLPLNTWTFLAVTYGGYTLRLYVNGSIVAAQSASSMIATSNGPLRIGGNSVYGEYFQGLIDNVRIYNRSLTQADVLADMNSAVPGPGDTTAPSVAITSPVGGATVSGTVTLSANASDNVGVAGVQFKVDGQNVGSELTAPPYSIAWNSASVADGSHTLTAVARDAAGNTATSTPVSVTVANGRPAGLVAAYSFDQGSGTTLSDLSGNGNNGTLQNATWSSVGKFGGALSFNGSSSMVSVPDAASLDLTTGMTLEAWIEPTTATSWRNVLFKQQPGGMVYSLYATEGTGHADLQVNIGGEKNAIDPYATPVNSWTFYAGTYDGTYLRLWANGVNIQTITVGGPIPISSGALTMGGDTVWNEWFQGLIDNVRIYNRALGGSEIQADMNTAVTAGPAPDTQAPTTPTGFTATSATQTSISTSWTASSDNVGVAGYHLYKGGVSVATTASTSYTFTGLACGTSYSLAVDAYDAAGNRSSQATLTASTTACNDTQAPTTPTGFTATGSTQTSISTSWTASTDNVGVAGYNLYSNGTKVGSTTATSFTFAGLSCGTSYTLAVEAFDAAGNVSSRAALAAATAACSPTPTPSNPCGVASTPPATFQHVIWIWMENKAYNQIIGSSSAPYINQLANSCGLATNYSAITHPSLPNYIAATSGGTQGIADDNPPSSHPLAVNSLFQQASSAGSYEESMPSNCDLTDASPYAVKHNPQAYYTNIRTACASTNVPLGSTSSGNLLNALNSNTLPAFTFITPNLCNDMHDCSVATGDSWLQSWVPKIISSPGYQNGSTAIFITWDEDDSSSANHVATVVVSPYTPVGKTSATAYTHYSLLRTTEQMLGIGTYLGNAATASSMSSDFFGGAAPAGSPSLPGGPLVPASGALFGAWVKDTTTTWTQADVANFESMIGRKLKIDMRYYSWSTNLPTADESWDLQNGRIPMIDWEPMGTTLDAINGGSYDSYVRGVATGLKSLGQPVFLRPMQEMNGDWYPWDGYHNNSTGATDGPSKFVQAWRRIHDIFTNAGATNVVWVWSPNWESVPKDTWNAIANYYPGDAYVDWVGIDGYNWGTTQSWGSTWMAYASIQSPIYNLYASVKPVMTSETASCEQGGDKAQWITDARNAIESQFPDIRAFIWFDMNKECDWRVNSSTTALAAYRAMAADGYFNP